MPFGTDLRGHQGTLLSWPEGPATHKLTFQLDDATRLREGIAAARGTFVLCLSAVCSSRIPAPSAQSDLHPLDGAGRGRGSAIVDLFLERRIERQLVRRW